MSAKTGKRKNRKNEKTGFAYLSVLQKTRSSHKVRSLGLGGVPNELVQKSAQVRIGTLLAKLCTIHPDTAREFAKPLRVCPACQVVNGWQIRTLTAGTVLEKGTQVQIVISKEEELDNHTNTTEPNTTTYVIPDGLVGMKTEDTVEVLNGMGIRVKVSTNDLIGLVGPANAPDVDPFGFVDQVYPSEGSEYVQIDDGNNYVLIICRE